MIEINTEGSYFLFKPEECFPSSHVRAKYIELESMCTLYNVVNVVMFGFPVCSLYFCGLVVVHDHVDVGCLGNLDFLAVVKTVIGSVSKKISFSFRDPLSNKKINFSFVNWILLFVTMVISLLVYCF